MKKLVFVVTFVGSFLGTSFGIQSFVITQSEFNPVVKTTPINIRKYVRLIAANGGNGSGVVIKPGVILTAKHVAEVPLELFIEPEHIKVTLIRASKEHDIAIVSAPGITCPCVTLSPTAPSVDELVSIVGFPLNDNIKTQLRTEGSIQGILNDMFITTANATFGNSGGGLFWKDYLVGILVQVPSQPIGFAGIPVNYIGMAVDIKTIKEFLGSDA